MKIYTVTEINGKPAIRITGKWLKEKGFDIGDKFEVVYEGNMLVLIKITKEEAEKIKKIYKQLS